MGLHDPFGQFYCKLWPKERSGHPTIKSQKSPWFPYVKVACDIPLERPRRGIQLFFKPHFNWRFVEKVMGPKVVTVPPLGISRLPLGSPRTKCHLGVSPVARHKVYFKGEGGGFHQVRAMVNLVNPSLPVACLSTKSILTMH